MIIKKWNGSAWQEQYPKTTHSQIVASGTASSSTYLRGDGSWQVPPMRAISSTASNGATTTAISRDWAYKIESESMTFGGTKTFSSKVTLSGGLNEIRANGALKFWVGTEAQLPGTRSSDTLYICT